MIEHKGILWINYQNALIPNVPPDVNIKLTEQDKRVLLKKSGAFFLRWTDNFDCKESGFWYVLKDTKPSMQELTSKMRNCVKHAINDFDVKKVDIDFIIDNAYGVYAAAFQTYKTFLKPQSEGVFKAGITKLKGNSEYEFWAVFCKQSGELAAYAQNRITQGYCDYKIIKLHPEYRKLNAGYALIYTMNEYYLNEKGFRYVCDGVRSLSHETNIQDFLIEKFKFRRAYCRLNVAYNPVVGIVVKILLPFSGIIEKSQLNFARKIMVLLRHEMIVRDKL